MAPPLPGIIPEDLTKKRFIWKTFFRQEDAFAFCDAARMPLHTFSYEAPGMEGGKRKFLVATYEALCHRYLNMPPDKRHVYELIREDRPVKTNPP